MKRQNQPRHLRLVKSDEEESSSTLLYGVWVKADTAEMLQKIERIKRSIQRIDELMKQMREEAEEKKRDYHS